MNKVLVVDDQQILRITLTEILEESGFSVTAVAGGRKAIEVFKNERPSAVLLDLKMPDMDGIETMQELKKIDADVPVILVTAHGDIETAVEAIKMGAYDFIVKPPKFDRLMLTLKRAIEKLELKRKVENLNIAFETSLEWLLGSSDIIKKIIKQIHQVAWSDFSLIIQGETGTGKTTVARAIHNLSKRAKGPFINVDMGTMPETLVESELFGYEKGAFTGAERKKKGFFECADGGTILIDEVQNIPPHIQGKLLRVVEEKKISPLGSTETLNIDIRVIAATNIDIKEAVAQKKFREDLFFRLGEFMITLPPLRERIDDIPFFSRRFLREAASEMNKQIRGISDDVLELLVKYPWPGNVRELKNMIRKAVLLSSGDMIMPEHVEFLIGDKCGSDTDNLAFMPLKEVSAIAVRDVERKAIKQALDMTKGNKTKAAAMLQIDYKTLLTKIKEYAIS
ncbi:MAG: sigma-54 dependent transcriptional regulator [Nitrospirae bacterium]|nr:sigma-54 dependent transcriptional regulator [Nitrospirota bacterium]MCL5977780.1 sigma-54 dependent transcriptional regulator [Nitrospirota bacterium]